MILDNKEDFMEENEMNLKKVENSKGGTLKYIIIALLVLVAIIVVVLLIMFNQKSTPKEIFNASITNLREQLNLLEYTILTFKCEEIYDQKEERNPRKDLELLIIFRIDFAI